MKCPKKIKRQIQSDDEHLKVKIIDLKNIIAEHEKGLDKIEVIAAELHGNVRREICSIKNRNRTDSSAVPEHQSSESILLRIQPG